LKVIVDTNVVLDVLLARKPFVQPAARVFALVEQSRIDGVLCATTITTIDYLMNLSLSKPDAREALHRLIELFDIAPVNRSVIEEALKSKMKDFEDAVLSHAGDLVGVDAVVTRNTQDFRQAPVKALDPTELISILSE